jgi:hypothetical protein
LLAPELGGLAPLPDGVAIGLLLTDGEGTEAALARVDARAFAARTTRLGRVHGGAAPPKVVASGDGIIAAVNDSDAAGSTLRLARLDRDATQAARSRDFSVGRKTTGAFDVGLSGGRGLLVWDAEESRSGRGAVYAVTFDPNDLEKTSEPQTVAATEGDDAEAPRLLARKGGYWLLWAAYGKLDRDVSIDADAGGVLDPVPRFIRAVPLDATGDALGEPRTLTAEARRVLSFDTAVNESGKLLLSFRHDADRPGIASAEVHLTALGMDGNVGTRTLENERLSAGSPTLLVDATPPKGTPASFLVLPGQEGTSEVLSLDAEGHPRGSWFTGAALAGDIVAARSGQFLLVRDKGSVIELAAARCR